ncbi:MAG: hypothetical protein MJ159_00220 [Treponemataceae bacterium]|nr:hypothetical protein [Treponemataceae bacterium]
MIKKLFLLLFLMCAFFCFAEEIEIARISATSTLSSAKKSYNAENLIDETSASWVEGEDGSGLGTKIIIEFKTQVILSEFYIKNGCGDFEYFYANNRVKKLSCTFSNKANGIILLEDKPGFQKVQFSKPVKTNRIELTIEEVYRGEKFDETAIAEISFKDWSKLDHTKMNESIFMNGINDLYEIYKKTDESLGQRVYKSAFTFPRNNARQGSDWFSISLSRQVIPLKNGDVYFLTSLPGECFGLKGANYSNSAYYLFTKLENKKIIPDQSFIPSLGTKDDIEYLESIKNTQKNFIEKYINLIKTVESSKQTNTPFLCELFNIKIDKSDFSVNFNLLEYVSVPPKVMHLFPGTISKIIYEAPYKRITNINTPDR